MYLIIDLVIDLAVDLAIKLFIKGHQSIDVFYHRSSQRSITKFIYFRVESN
jgi:hypothetical protein